MNPIGLNGFSLLPAELCSSEINILINQYFHFDESLLNYISDRFAIFNSLAAFALIILYHGSNVLNVFLLNIRQI